MLAPPAFLAALVAYLAAGPRAATSFTVYPFLADILGSGLPRSNVARFVVVTSLFFVVPYLVSGVLLLLADVGTSAAASLWRRERRVPVAGPRPPLLAPETFWTLVVAALVLAAVAGSQLPKVAHGGELPGGVNVAPVFVAAVPFAALAFALVLAAIASIPRVVARRLGPRKPLDDGL